MPAAMSGDERLGKPASKIIERRPGFSRSPLNRSSQQQASRVITVCGSVIDRSLCTCDRCVIEKHLDSGGKLAGQADH